MVQNDIDRAMRSTYRRDWVALNLPATRPLTAFGMAKDTCIVARACDDGLRSRTRRSRQHYCRILRIIKRRDEMFGTFRRQLTSGRWNRSPPTAGGGRGEALAPPPLPYSLLTLRALSPDPWTADDPILLALSCSMGLQPCCSSILPQLRSLGEAPNLEPCTST